MKYKVNQTYFNSWTTSMAYVLGYLFADGSVEEWIKFRAHYVKAVSTDKEQIEMLKKELKSEHPIEIIKSPFNNHKTKYRLRMGDKKLFESLKYLGLEPKKSLTMSLPKIPPKYLADFVRGYFDGDGCIYFEKYNGKPKRLRLLFTSGSKKFLDKLSIELQSRLNLKQSKVYNSRRSYQLAYSTADSIKIYKFMYKNSPKMLLKRKLEVFTKAFKECNNWKVIALS